MELTQAQIDWLNECTQGAWSLNKKGLVDIIDGYFVCISQDLKDFKGVKFGKVKGSFDCSRNKLTSLVGAPQEVGGSFYCGDNKLTSLVGAPQKVEGYFYCSYNQLTSLEGGPQVVGRSFDCRYNKLTSLEGAPQKVGGGDFYYHNNPITAATLKLIHKTMVERDVPYIIALGLLKTSIDKKEFDKLWGGLSNDTLKGASMMGRFLCP